MFQEIPSPWARELMEGILRLPFSFILFFVGPLLLFSYKLYLTPKEIHPRKDRTLRKTRTFRLSEIDISVSKATLKGALNRLQCEEEHTGENVRFISLAKSHGRWQVGTVTFYEEPADFRSCIVSRPRYITLYDDSGSLLDPVKVDCDFTGITPLCGPSDPVEGGIE